MKAILDTSVLVSADKPDLAGLEWRISSLSYAEMHFGLTVARDDHERNQRMLRFNRVLSLYGNGMAFDDRVAGSYSNCCRSVARSLPNGLCPKAKTMRRRHAGSRCREQPSVIS